MEAQFWINAWNEGRTGFHLEKFNPKLIQHFPHFHPQPGQKVLVPLCGKTKDLLWLSEQGLRVHGVELYEKAVESFFSENDLTPQKVQDQFFKNYISQNITISVGDFFKLDSFETYDFIYDRASLVALPPSMRKDYAEVVTRALKTGGKYLLVVFEYDQSKMDGPPFSIDANEVHRLYQDHFTIKFMEVEKVPSNEIFNQKVYILEKKGSP